MLASGVLNTLCKHHGGKQRRLNFSKKFVLKKLLYIHTYTWESKLVIENLLVWGFTVGNHAKEEND